MDKRAKELVEIGDKMFDRQSLMSLWQDLYENFCPERATFTATRTLGDDFASYLETGFPALQLRDLADQLASMLRPRQILWAKIVASDQRRNADTDARKWLEWASELQRHAMYEKRAGFLRATKVADLDFAAAGQCVILPSMNPTLDGLLYREFHLKDVAWYEGLDRLINHVQRKEKICVRDMVRTFPKTTPQKIKDLLEKEPYKEFNIRHIVLPAADYQPTKKYNRDRFPYYSLYIQCEEEEILEEIPQPRLGYVIPRWRMGAFNQYAISPAAMLALPDARMMQQMAQSIGEAGEMAVKPPMVATEEAVRTDAQLYSGGITWVDRDYDERLGDALRPLNLEFRGLQFGYKLLEDVRELMKDIFFLNKINLPNLGHEMTAFETRKRMEEYIRAALPLFEPMETEYNAALCEETFNVLADHNAFGPPESLPPALRGADVRFDFVSPLQQTAERAKLQSFTEGAQVTQMAQQMDPEAALNWDIKKAYRDALRGAEVPADQMIPIDVVRQLIARQRLDQQQQREAASIEQAANIANKAAPAVKALQGS